MKDEVVGCDDRHSLIKGYATDYLVDVVLHLLAIGSAKVGHHSLSWLRIQIQKGVTQGSFEAMLDR